MYTLSETFRVAGGSVTGSRHRQAGRNNQDAFGWAASGAAIAAIVSDGCSGGVHSEVGAKLAAQFLASTLPDLAASGSPVRTPREMEALLERARRLLLGRTVAFAPTEAVMADYFLFTVVGALIADRLAAVFSLGDGVIAVNGRIEKIQPRRENEPDYLCYELLGLPSDCRFRLHACLPTSSLDSLLIATDGASDLRALSEFWEDDATFGNRDAVRRRLAVLNRSVTTPDWRNRRLVRREGELPDDTTLIVARRATDYATGGL